jgi:hypothetical protein
MKKSLAERLEEAANWYLGLRGTDKRVKHVPDGLKKEVRTLKDEGLTLTEMAEKFGVTVPAISSWLSSIQEKDEKPIGVGSQKITVKEDMIEVEINGKRIKAPFSVIKKLMS